MQTGWDQQTVDETKDTGTQRPRRNDPLATRAWMAFCCTGGQT